MDVLHIGKIARNVSGVPWINIIFALQKLFHMNLINGKSIYFERNWTPFFDHFRETKHADNQWLLEAISWLLFFSEIMGHANNMWHVLIFLTSPYLYTPGVNLISVKSAHFSHERNFGQLFSSHMYVVKAAKMYVCTKSSYV
jgi:hypothetical protein